MNNWCNAKFLQICSDEETNTSWNDLRESKLSASFHFWVNYSFKKRLTILGSWGALWGNVAVCNHSSPYSCAPLDTIWVQHCCTSQPQPWWSQKGRAISKREEFDGEYSHFCSVVTLYTTGNYNWQPAPIWRLQHPPPTSAVFSLLPAHSTPFQCRRWPFWLFLGVWMQDHHLELSLGILSLQHRWIIAKWYPQKLDRI